jgi:predicted negative regulator of RcsB-dependent stress response
VDRLTRKELKTDKFALEVGHTVEFLGEHRKQVLRYGGIVLAVALVAGGGWFWMRYQHGVRQKALAEAMRVQNATIGPPPNTNVLTFPTQAEKDTALAKALGELSARHAGSEEGTIADYLMGINAVDAGRIIEGEKFLRKAVETGEGPYVALAKLSLADVLAAAGKTAEAEKLLRELVASPTILVSSEQATINLARVVASSKPAEALKLLDPLRSKAGPISRAAISAYAEIAQAKPQ